MRSLRLTALALAALLAVGCGDILKELDGANDLAGKPTGNRPPPSPGQPGAVPKPGAAPAATTAARPGEPPEAAPGLLAQIESWLGIGDAKTDSRPPRDPNDPMVICRLGGSTSFMLKSGCVNRRGTVVASRGVPR